MRKPLIEGKNHFFAVYYIYEDHPSFYSGYNSQGWCIRSIKQNLALAKNAKYPFIKAEIYLENAVFDFPNNMLLLNTYYPLQDE